MTRSPRRCASRRKRWKSFSVPYDGMNVGVVGDVVAVVAQRRGAEGQKPDRRDAQIFQVIELLRQAAEIADAVGDAVEKGAHVNFIDDRVFVPGDVGEQIHDRR